MHLCVDPSNLPLTVDCWRRRELWALFRNVRNIVSMQGGPEAKVAEQNPFYRHQHELDSLKVLRRVRKVEMGFTDGDIVDSVRLNLVYDDHCEEGGEPTEGKGERGEDAAL